MAARTGSTLSGRCSTACRALRTDGVGAARNRRRPGGGGRGPSPSRGPAGPARSCPTWPARPGRRASSGPAATRPSVACSPAIPDPAARPRPRRDAGRARISSAAGPGARFASASGAACTSRSRPAGCRRAPSRSPRSSACAIRSSPTRAPSSARCRGPGSPARPARLPPPAPAGVARETIRWTRRTVRPAPEPSRAVHHPAGDPRTDDYSAFLGRGPRSSPTSSAGSATRCRRCSPSATPGSPRRVPGRGPNPFRRPCRGHRQPPGVPGVPRPRRLERAGGGWLARRLGSLSSRPWRWATSSTTSR